MPVDEKPVDEKPVEGKPVEEKGASEGIGARGQELARGVAAARDQGDVARAVEISEERLSQARAAVTLGAGVPAYLELGDALYLRAALAMEDEQEPGRAWELLMDRLEVLARVVTLAPVDAHFRLHVEALGTLTQFVDPETHGEVYVGFLRERAVAARRWLYESKDPAEAAAVLADCAEAVGQLAMNAGDGATALAAWHDAIRGLEIVAQTTEANAHAILRMAAAHYNAAAVSEGQDRAEHLETAFTITSHLEQGGLHHEAVTKIRQGAATALAADRLSAQFGEE